MVSLEGKEWRHQFAPVSFGHCGFVLIWREQRYVTTQLRIQRSKISCKPFTRTKVVFFGSKFLDAKYRKEFYDASFFSFGFCIFSERKQRYPCSIIKSSSVSSFEVTCFFGPKQIRNCIRTFVSYVYWKSIEWLREVLRKFTSTKFRGKLSFHSNKRLG